MRQHECPHGHPTQVVYLGDGWFARAAIKCSLCDGWKTAAYRDEEALAERTKEGKTDQ